MVSRGASGTCQRCHWCAAVSPGVGGPRVGSVCACVSCVHAYARLCPACTRMRARVSCLLALPGSLSFVVLNRFGVGQRCPVQSSQGWPFRVG